MRHLFIINPKAGEGKTKDIIPLIEKIRRKEAIDCILKLQRVDMENSRKLYQQRVYEEHL